MSEKVDIRLEFTPNPDALKYVVDEHVFLERGAANFSDLAKAEKSPLARRLLSLDDVENCLIGRNYVAITKSSDGDWERLDDLVREAITAHIESGDPSVDPVVLEDIAKESAASNVDADSVEGKIRAVLDNEIRPAVAQDGGDIVFERFEDGVVYVYMQGACSGCPSSTATLKQGIEARLKEVVPEVQEVVQL